MVDIVEERVRPNVYAICPIVGAPDEQRCRDIADELLVRLTWRVLGSDSERMIPAAFTLEWSDGVGILHALLRCPERVSIGDFSGMLSDQLKQGGWGAYDIQIGLRDTGCVRKAVAHSLDTFLIIS